MLFSGAVHLGPGARPAVGVPGALLPSLAQHWGALGPRGVLAPGPLGAELRVCSSAVLTQAGFLDARGLPVYFSSDAVTLARLVVRLLFLWLGELEKRVANAGLAVLERGVGADALMDHTTLVAGLVPGDSPASAGGRAESGGIVAWRTWRVVRWRRRRAAAGSGPGTPEAQAADNQGLADVFAAPVLAAEGGGAPGTDGEGADPAPFEWDFGLPESPGGQGSQDPLSQEDGAAPLDPPGPAGLRRGRAKGRGQGRRRSCPRTLPSCWSRTTMARRTPAGCLRGSRGLRRGRGTSGGRSATGCSPWTTTTMCSRRRACAESGSQLQRMQGGVVEALGSPKPDLSGRVGRPAGQVSWPRLPRPALRLCRRPAMRPSEVSPAPVCPAWCRVLQSGQPGGGPGVLVHALALSACLSAAATAGPSAGTAL